MNSGYIHSALLAFVGSAVVAVSLGITRGEGPMPRKYAALEEIERQRARFGSPLAGTSFDGASQADAAAFAEAYRQRVANDQPDAMTRINDSRDSLMMLDPRSRYVAALREAARLLDHTAADLEESEAYAHADSLRERASQLRLEARRASGFTACEKQAE